MVRLVSCKRELPISLDCAIKTTVGIFQNSFSWLGKIKRGGVKSVLLAQAFLYHCQDFNWTWLYILVTRRVSCKKPSWAPGFTPKFCFGNVCLVFCVVLLCLFTFWVPCCDDCYDYRIKTMFGRPYLRLFVGGLLVDVV